MRIGTLNRRVLLQRRVDVQNEIGEEVSTWQDIGMVWASIVKPTGMQTARSDVPVAVTKASIRIRFREDLDATCRVLHGPIVYDIRAVLPDDVSREYVDLSVEAGQNNG